MKELKPPHKIQTDKAFVDACSIIQSKETLNIDTSMSYIILNSDKEYLCNDDHSKRLYNSIILEPKAHTVMGIGPPLAYELQTYKELYPESTIDVSNMVIEEMIEGVFIQMFFDYRIHKWEIATRNSVSGNYSYYHIAMDGGERAPTYREMFLDALGRKSETPQLDIDSWDGIPYLDQKCCYHFILQHPNNHMVLNDISPQVYFTGFYRMHVDSIANNIQFVSSQTVSVFPETLTVKIPRVAPAHTPFTYDKNIDVYTSAHCEYLVMGLSFLHKYTGDRCFVIHDRYKQLQQLRGTNSNLLYQYLCLRRISKIHEFLKYFPQYRKVFWKYHEMYESLIQLMHQSYFEYYIKKTRETVHKKIFYHISQIHHTIYKPSLQEKEKTIIRKAIVRKYLGELEPGNILHLLQNELYKQEGVV